MIEQRVYSAAELPPLLECQVRDFVRIVWPEAHVDYPSVPLDDVEHEPRHFVIVDGDVLVSNAQVITLTIEHAGETYRVGGLGGVMTYPNFRRGGYGVQVVAAATQAIAASDVDFGMLFTSSDLEGFYHRNGWIGLPDITILKGDKNSPLVHQEFTMSYPVSPRGQQALAIFKNAQVYIGPHNW